MINRWMVNKEVVGHRNVMTSIWEAVEKYLYLQKVQYWQEDTIELYARLVFVEQALQLCYDSNMDEYIVEYLNTGNVVKVDIRRYVFLYHPEMIYRIAFLDQRGFLC